MFIPDCLCGFCFRFDVHLKTLRREREPLCPGEWGQSAVTPSSRFATVVLGVKVTPTTRPNPAAVYVSNPEFTASALKASTDPGKTSEPGSLR